MRARVPRDAKPGGRASRRRRDCFWSRAGANRDDPNGDDTGPGARRARYGNSDPPTSTHPPTRNRPSPARSARPNSSTHRVLPTPDSPEMTAAPASPAFARNSAARKASHCSCRPTKSGLATRIPTPDAPLRDGRTPDARTPHLAASFRGAALSLAAFGARASGQRPRGVQLVIRTGVWSGSS